MRVLCVLDHFGPGGAQKQMVELACGLKRRGHDIRVFAYFPQYDFLRARLNAEGIPISVVVKKHKLSLRVLQGLSALIRAENPDIVVSYLNTPSIYAELARLSAHKVRLVVSERSSHKDDRSRFFADIRRNLHRLADHIVVNSYAHRRYLENRFAWLVRKISVVYNGVTSFPEADEGNVTFDKMNPPSLIAVGRIGPEKNIINLIKGCQMHSNHSGTYPKITWVGPRDYSSRGHQYWNHVNELLVQMPGVKQNWEWLGTRGDIPELIRKHHALIHPSFYEGLPNAVCESLACGRPVLASNVCDHGVLVADAERGFLFDPSDPESIATAIARLTHLPAEKWDTLCRNAREYAASELNMEKMISSYESIFRTLTER